MDYPKSVAGVGLLNGKFTDGDAASGIKGSLDPASWANAITDEQLAIIVAAGLSPDETKSNQVLAALQVLFASRASSVTRKDLGTVDLNTLTGDSYTGFYAQGANAGASLALNYPIAAAGMLTVLSYGWVTTQMYQHYNNGSVYYRSCYNGTWSSWQQSAMLSSPAFTGSPTAPTPALFDNSTRLVTTAFLQRAGWFTGTVTLVTASKTLTTADVGSTQVGSATAAVTVTLPPAASIPAGAKIEFWNFSTGVMTISRAGSDTIAAGSQSLTSIALNIGDSLVLTGTGGAALYATGGTAQLAYANAFSASRAANGYQKLPGGLILQWGSIADTAAGTTRDMPYNISFPTTCVCLEITPWQNAVGLPYSHTGRGTTPNIMRTVSAGAWSFDWFAIGY